MFAADGYTAIEIDDLADIDGLLLQTRQLCRYGDRVYTRGTFQVAPCIWCECTPQGDTKCWAQTCPGDGGAGKWEPGLTEPDPDSECIKYDRLMVNAARRALNSDVNIMGLRTSEDPPL